MKRHAFGFGSEIDATFMSGLDPKADPQDVRRFRAVVEELFDRVVPGNGYKHFYWPADAGAFKQQIALRRSRSALQ